MTFSLRDTHRFWIVGVERSAPMLAQAAGRFLRVTSSSATGLRLQDAQERNGYARQNLTRVPIQYLIGAPGA
jgi:hypothetical protein